MPFQSEKQRRYLWANEPEIARDWTDTYGSRIKKDDGGIMDTKTIKGQPHMLAYITRGEAKDLQKLGGKKTLTAEGIPAYPPQGKAEQFGGSSSSSSRSSSSSSSSNKGGGKQPGGPKNLSSAQKQQQYDAVQNLQDAMKGQGSGSGAGDYVKMQQHLEDPRRHDPPEIKKTLGDKFKFPSFWGMGIDAAKKFKAWNNVKQRQNFLKQLKVGPGGLGDMDLYDEDYLLSAQGLAKLNELGYQKYLNRFQQGEGAGSGGGDGQRGGYMGYPSYEAWKAAQGAQGTGATAAVAPQLSAFQQSLTAGANNPFDYYVGTTPGAKNLAWGKQMGVDPRTMGLTSFAADGGRIGRAYGGIMDTATGRRAYGFGSIFKKVGRAAKKVLKSPIGKAALLGAGFYYGGGKLPFFGQRAGATGFGSKGFGMKQLAGMLKGGGKYADDAWNPWKLGIMGASALPFFMGGEEEDEGSKFDYDAAKNAYRDELMRIKAGSMAGTLNPNEFSYLPTYKEGGRIGLEDGGDPLLREEYNKYVFEMEEMGLVPMSFEEFAAQARAGMYSGGQATPSDYTMEDARKTSTQDKMGGITDTMKRAHLYSQGDVGQMYMAEGGQICIPKKSYPWPKEERATAQEGGLMDLGGMEKDYRNDGGFVPIGEYEKKDDVPARLSKNEFVFTADAVRGAGGGDIDKGAEIMENIMKNLEQGGKISEETQGLSGAQEMFSVSERLSEVV